MWLWMIWACSVTDPVGSSSSSEPSRVPPEPPMVLEEGATGPRVPTSDPVSSAPAPADSASRPGDARLRAEVHMHAERATPDLLETLKRYGGQPKYCYEQALKRDPRIQGKLSLELGVADGYVRHVAMKSTTLDDDRLEDCMVDKARRWRFPADLEGAWTIGWTFSPVYGD